MQVMGLEAWPLRHASRVRVHNAKRKSLGETNGRRRRLGLGLLPNPIHSQSSLVSVSYPLKTSHTLATAAWSSLTLTLTLRLLIPGFFRPFVLPPLLSLFTSRYYFRDPRYVRLAALC